MEIVIRGGAKEIAALVLAVQERQQTQSITFKCDIRDTAEIIHASMRDKPIEARPHI